MDYGLFARKTVINHLEGNFFYTFHIERQKIL